MELKPSVQKYAWGKRAQDSKVFALYRHTEPDSVVDNSTYAELWMGTHPSGPSKLKSSGELLSAVIGQNPDYLGPASVEKFGNDIPFLFKVLSVNTALSIQAHPAKKHAEELNLKFPNIYKDANHKPELAIALTPFKAMCGFRPTDEIRNFLNVVPEFKLAVGEDNANNLIKASSSDEESCLKECFKALMCCSDDKIKQLLGDALQRFKNLDSEGRVIQLANLIEHLFADFPNDVGCFAPYFFNVLDLQINEAIYLGPNVPHAYISGDCVECMACSDNVVRAGLTPKFKDVEILCSMLNYKGTPAKAQIFEPIVENEFTKLYKPPVPDFALAKIDVSCNTKSLELIKRKTCSIILCIEGTGKLNEIDLVAGSVIFIPANGSGNVVNHGGRMLMFQAVANV